MTTVRFPQPGAQDCYNADPLTADGTFRAQGTVPDGTVIRRVRVFIGDNDANGTTSDQVAAPVAGTWTAVFSTITKANSLLRPNTPCRLLVETSDQTNIGLRFIHVPLPAQVNIINVTAGANRALSVTGTAVNIDMGTLAVAASAATVSNLQKPGGNAFSFTLTATGSAAQQPIVTISGWNVDEEEPISFEFQMLADFQLPTFGMNFDVSAIDIAVVVSGVARDDAGPNGPSSGFQTDGAQFAATLKGIAIPAAQYDFIYDPPGGASATGFSYQLNLPDAEPGDVVQITITDRSGNAQVQNRPVPPPNA